MGATPAQKIRTICNHGPSFRNDIRNCQSHHSPRPFTKLALIEKSLESTPLDKQDFSMVTVAISKAKLPEAKARIKAFRRELAAFLDAGSKDEVYNLSMYLFPLTKNLKGESL